MTTCLSIRQPWAWAIVSGFKPVENRTWWTHVRGRILIHAGAQWDCGKASGMDDIAEWSRTYGVAPPEQVHMGGIVGEAELVDCVTAHPSEFFCGPYAFVLRNARPLPFRPWKGRLGFFDVPEVA